MRVCQLFLMICIIAVGSIFATCTNKPKAESIESEQTNKMDESLLEKIENSRKAYKMASKLDSMLTEKYSIQDLVVACTVEGEVVITGEVDNEETKNEIGKFLSENEVVKNLTNDLTVKE